MRSLYPIAAFALTVALAVNANAQKTRTAPLRLSPAQAVINAAEMPGGVGGVFEMVVRATGRQGGFLYLNSEVDYRDPRNLTIVIGPAQERTLAERFGQPVETSVFQKVIAVRGVAKKTRIDFTAEGRATGKYYFQTHLVLTTARDPTIEGERPIP